MFLWLLAFWALGYFALPNSLDLLGLERGDLSARGQVDAQATSLHLESVARSASCDSPADRVPDHHKPLANRVGNRLIILLLGSS